MDGRSDVTFLAAGVYSNATNGGMAGRDHVFCTTDGALVPDIDLNLMYSSVRSSVGRSILVMLQ